MVSSYISVSMEVLVEDVIPEMLQNFPILVRKSLESHRVEGMNNDFASSTTGKLSTQLRPAPWATVLWDDPLNLKRYVARILCVHFGYSIGQAQELVAEISTTGRGIVSLGVRERVEADVLALHAFGLRATMELTKTGETRVKSGKDRNQ